MSGLLPPSSVPLVFDLMPMSVLVPLLVTVKVPVPVPVTMPMTMPPALPTQLSPGWVVVSGMLGGTSESPVGPFSLLAPWAHFQSDRA